jgi:hypothetical protein
MLLRWVLATALVLLRAPVDGGSVAPSSTKKAKVYANLVGFTSDDFDTDQQTVLRLALASYFNNVTVNNITLDNSTSGDVHRYLGSSSSTYEVNAGSIAVTVLEKSACTKYQKSAHRRLGSGGCPNFRRRLAGTTSVPTAIACYDDPCVQIEVIGGDCEVESCPGGGAAHRRLAGSSTGSGDCDCSEVCTQHRRLGVSSVSSEVCDTHRRLGDSSASVYPNTCAAYQKMGQLDVAKLAKRVEEAYEDMKYMGLDNKNANDWIFHKDSAKTGCYPGPVVAAGHPLFQLGEYLKIGDVALALALIIGFSYALETLLEKIYEWIQYYNAMFKACLDKVTNELMILGAISFTLTILEETLPSPAGSNGIAEIMGAEAEHTLHWMDVVIFVFAIIFVLAAIYILLLIGWGTAILAPMDARNIGLLLDEFKTDTRGRRRSILSQAQKQKKSRTDPKLLAEVRGLLKKFAPTNEVQREPAQHRLPNDVVVCALHKDGIADEEFEQDENNLHEFLVSAEKTREFFVEPAHRRHLHIIMNPLCELNVCETKSEDRPRGRALVITKCEISSWVLDQRTELESVETYTTFFKANKVDRETIQSKRKEWGRWKVARKCKELQYHLLKHMFFEEHYTEKIIGKSAKHRGKVDFSFYIETAVVLRIIESFEIEFGDWVVLFIATVPVLPHFPGSKCYDDASQAPKGDRAVQSFGCNYSNFLIACAVLTGVSIVITIFLFKYIHRLLQLRLRIKDPGSLVELVEKAQEVHLKLVHFDRVEAFTEHTAELAREKAAQKSRSPKNQLEFYPEIKSSIEPEVTSLTPKTKKRGIGRSDSSAIFMVKAQMHNASNPEVPSPPPPKRLAEAEKVA